MRPNLSTFRAQGVRCQHTSASPRAHDTGGTALLASTRRREIFNRLITDGYIEAKELAQELGVDTSTIRRDLEALEREGQVQRTHGGARPVPGITADLPY